MNFAQEQRRPTRHLVAIVFVILLHIVLVWAMASGLAQKIARVVHHPMIVQIKDEPPPPPPKELPPPPPPAPNLPPPPIFVPQVEVQVTPPPDAPVPQVVTTNVQPVEHTVPAPTPVKPDTPPAPVAPATINSGLCSNLKEISDAMSDKFSVIADKEGITSASATAIIVLGPNGDVKDVTISGTSYSSLKSLLRNSLPKLHCRGQGVDVTTRYPVEFKLAD